MELGRDEFGSSSRAKIFLALFISVCVLYSVRLAYLQIIHGNLYLLKTESQAIKEVINTPFRGIILDREGNKIVHNKPSFVIRITPADFDEAMLPRVAKLLGVDVSLIQANFKKFKTKSPFTPFPILKDASPIQANSIEENLSDLPGVDVSVESGRFYEFEGNLSHLLGYTREISESQLKRNDDFYRPGDPIGNGGIESSFERLLRGQKGSEFIAVNAYGQRVSAFYDGKNTIPAVEGFDLQLSIDSDLQYEAEQLLDGKRGAVVAMDPNTGEILAYVSKPDYSLEVFNGRTSASEYGKLMKDVHKPLFDRVIMTKYPPGSTWKMLMVIAAMNEGILPLDGKIVCNGSFTYGGRTWKDHGSHGAIGARKAIHVSSNVFFYKLGLEIGLDTYHKYGEMFGFGKRTGIDVANEESGLLPSKAWYNKAFGKGKWSNGVLVNLGIGQGELGVTPLQLLVYTATIATKGIINRPHVVKAIYNKRTNSFDEMEVESRELPIKKEIFNLIHQGMYDVVNVGGGTATNARLTDYKLCGKTGTAQNAHGQDHSWFVSFAPMENPKIAICVLAENAGFGATVAAPIASKLTKLYLDKLKNASMKNTIVTSQTKTVVKNTTSKTDKKQKINSL